MLELLDSDGPFFVDSADRDGDKKVTVILRKRDRESLSEFQTRADRTHARLSSILKMAIEAPDKAGKKKRCTFKIPCYSATEQVGVTSQLIGNLGQPKS